MIEKQDINFGWRYSPDFKQEYTKPDFKDNAFKLIDLPHSVHEASTDYVNDKSYHKISCYRKMVMLPITMKKRRLILHFEGVMSCAAVFVNGKPVGVHKGGFTPFEFDISDVVTDYLKESENLITVAVDSYPREDTAPCGTTEGPLMCGGIYRNVWIEASDEVRIQNVFARPFKDESGAWNLSLSGSLDFGKNAGKNKETELNFCLFEGSERLAATYNRCVGGSFDFNWKIPCAIAEWSPEKPLIYKLGASIGSDEKLCTIGFRTVETKQDGIYINGIKQRLWGASRTQNFARIGNAAPDSLQELDAQLLSELGFNCVRTLGSPPAESFLRRCDELGIMVIDELPGNSYLGPQQWRECLCENLRELILRDRNHPCVIAWGTQIENAPGDESFAKAINGIARQLDSSRPTIRISNLPAESDFPEDIFGYNKYTAPVSEGLFDKKKSVVKSKKPVVLCSLTGVSGLLPVNASQSESAGKALELARILDGAFAEKDSIGILAASLADYSSASGVFSSGICAGGICDAERTKKPIAALFESQFGKKPVLAAASSAYPGDYPGGVLPGLWVFTNCDSVKLYRNGSFIKEFLPDKKSFPQLPHPPVLIDDFIGDISKLESGIGEREAVAVKSALIAMWGDTTKPMSSAARAKTPAQKYRLPENKLAALYDKYLGNGFGGARLTLEGVLNGGSASSIVLEPVKEAGLRISCIRQELVSDATYDCVRVGLEAVDKNGNRLFECAQGISLDCEGSIEIMGPKLFALKNGSAVFYVRSRNGKGKARVKILTESLGTGLVDLTVSRNTK